MIAELGHYALVLALGLALVQAVRAALSARARDDAALMGVGGADGAGAIRLRRVVVRAR